MKIFLIEKHGLRVCLPALIGDPYGNAYSKNFGVQNAAARCGYTYNTEKSA